MSNGDYYSEEPGYCNIHGEAITVLVCQKTGRFAVPLDEIVSTGFRLYRKIQYSRLLVDDIQFNKEFDLHMLQSAQTYLLEHRVAFKENEILASIDKVKRILIEKQNESKTPNLNNNPSERSPQNLNQKSPLDKPNHGAFPKSVRGDLSSPQIHQHRANASPQTRNNESSPQGFMQGHTVEGNSESITVTANLRQPKTPITFQNNASFKARNGVESERAQRNSLEPEGGRGGFGAQKGRASFEQQRGRNNSEMNRSFESKGSSESLHSNKVNGEENGEVVAPHKLTKPTHTLLITHIEKSYNLAQDVDNADVLLKIDTLINNEIRSKPDTPTRAIWGKIYLGLDPDEKNWYRCKVFKFKPLSAFFVDYGNRAQIQMSDLREITNEELANIPPQAVKVTFTNASQKKPKLDDTVTVTVKDLYENTNTYLVEYADSATASQSSKPVAAPQLNSPPRPAPASQPPPSAPTTPTFFTKPSPLCELTNGQRVMIVGHEQGRMALRTKETYDVLKRIEGALAVAVTTPVEAAQKGQLVLYETDKLQRAVVVDVRRNDVVLELLDSCGSATTDVSSLRHISGSLAKQPVTYLMTPPVKGYSADADEKLQELVEKKAKATVILSGGDVDLDLGDGTLSAILQPPQKSGVVMMKDLAVWSPPIATDEYNLNVYFDEGAAYFSSMEVQEDFLNFILLTDLDDNEPYAPIEGEVCLGNYQGSWSRCVILGIKNGMYNIRFIDFGNLDDLDSENLRKLPDNCKTVPILAFKCRLTGFPPNRLKQLNEKMKEQEEKNLKVNVKKFNGASYEIEVPAIYNSLG